MFSQILMGNLWNVAAQNLIRVASGQALVITSPCFDGSYIEFNNDGKQIPAVERFTYYKTFDQFRIYHPANIITGAPTLTINGQTSVLIADNDACLSDFPTPDVIEFAGTASATFSVLCPKGYDVLDFHGIYTAGGAGISIWRLSGRIHGSLNYNGLMIDYTPRNNIYSNLYVNRFNISRFSAVQLALLNDTQNTGFIFSFNKTMG